MTPVSLRAGGGYTKNNVARCWAYETAVVVGADRDVEEDIPVSPLTAPYYEYFGPEHRLNLRGTREVKKASIMPRSRAPQLGAQVCSTA
jgi:hypothetical protein